MVITHTIFGQEQWLHLNFLDKYHGNIIILFDDIAKQMPWYIDKIDKANISEALHFYLIPSLLAYCIF